MHGSIRRVGPGLAAVLVAVPSGAPGQTVHYAYDAAGRLSVASAASIEFCRPIPSS